MARDPNKNYVLCEGGSKVWMWETMGWEAWVFDSAVRAERESVTVRYLVGWLFGRDDARKIASSSTVKTVAVLRSRYEYTLSPIDYARHDLLFILELCKADGWVLVVN